MSENHNSHKNDGLALRQKGPTVRCASGSFCPAMELKDRLQHTPLYSGHGKRIEDPYMYHLLLTMEYLTRYYLPELEFGDNDQVEVTAHVEAKLYDRQIIISARVLTPEPLQDEGVLENENRSGNDQANVGPALQQKGSMVRRWSQNFCPYRTADGVWLATVVEGRLGRRPLYDAKERRIDNPYMYYFLMAMQSFTDYDLPQLSFGENDQLQLRADIVPEDYLRQIIISARVLTPYIVPEGAAET